MLILFIGLPPARHTHPSLKRKILFSGSMGESETSATVRKIPKTGPVSSTILLLASITLLKNQCGLFDTGRALLTVRGELRQPMDNHFSLCLGIEARSVEGSS